MTPFFEKTLGMLCALCATFVFGVAQAQPKVPTVLRLAVMEGVPVVTDVQRPVIIELYRRANIPIVFEFLPFARSILEVDHGKMDGELGRFEQVEQIFKRIRRVPVPVVMIEYRPLVINDRYSKITSWESLKQSKLRIGVRNGATLLESKLGDAITDRLNTYESIYKMLLADRIDIAIVPGGTLEEYLERAPEEERASLQKIQKLPSLGSQAMYHYLNERHADLIPLLTRELQGMEKDGTLGKIWRLHERQIPKIK